MEKILKLDVSLFLQQNSQNDGDMRPVKEAWEVTQAELKEGLSAFFKQCGNAYNGTSGLVAMVAAMERRLDESMAAAAALPAGVAEEWQKGKEKERRQVHPQSSAISARQCNNSFTGCRTCKGKAQNSH